MGCNVVYNISETVLDSEREDELRELLEEVTSLLINNLLTEEQFAAIYGYMYLAKEQLVRI